MSGSAGHTHHMRGERRNVCTAHVVGRRERLPREVGAMSRWLVNPDRARKARWSQWLSALTVAGAVGAGAAVYALVFAVSVRFGDPAGAASLTAGFLAVLAWLVAGAAAFVLIGVFHRDESVFLPAELAEAAGDAELGERERWELALRARGSR